MMGSVGALERGLVGDFELGSVDSVSYPKPVADKHQPSGLAQAPGRNLAAAQPRTSSPSSLRCCRPTEAQTARLRIRCTRARTMA